MDLDETPEIRIGLALGGGAVRGAAHVGVLEVLDRAGLEPAVITGTSAGALVGALYAAGKPPSEILKLAQTLRWARLVRPARTRKALFETSKLGLFLETALDHATFDDLRLPFAAVACDLATGEEVVMRDGSVAQAVLASAAVPGVFPPVDRDGQMLVDGSLVNIVPAGVARRLGADIVVAVDVSGPLPRRPPATILHIMVAVSTLQPGGTGTLAKDADLVLSPEVDGYAFWELSRIGEFEQAGRSATEEALPLLRALTEAAAARKLWERTRQPTATQTSSSIP
ncbi:putative patatin-like phospholipase [Actinoplanes missouriensis 431]|uniref:Putative patatin-like phospholipase n=1 Tax=Actinoplanes missouriensis (strain ATCC 14538 / DSM 43046 / CBS 188.64 / JCM 3121 / NBRC 102363 / NCIMB 12654 / NRRL B-3342 / UNCC 431) TaxID=512565 RepID=I0HDK2_ACTM4|nr:patatin-like phospholipase family protein [Actinoplanes missouriensis]BAL91089.1 putative patatin-like phospholipase [Actinoplanes missouriensis 431]